MSLLDFLVFWVVIPAILILFAILWAQKNAAQKKLKRKRRERNHMGERGESERKSGNGHTGYEKNPERRQHTTQ